MCYECVVVRHRGRRPLRFVQRLDVESFVSIDVEVKYHRGVVMLRNFVSCHLICGGCKPSSHQAKLMGYTGRLVPLSIDSLQIIRWLYLVLKACWLARLAAVIPCGAAWPEKLSASFS